MVGEQEMLAPMVLAEVREGLETLGYKIDSMRIEADAIHVRLQNGITASEPIPVIDNIFDVSVEIAAELDKRLQG